MWYIQSVWRTLNAGLIFRDLTNEIGPFQQPAYLILDLIDPYIANLLATLRKDIKGQKYYLIDPGFKGLQLTPKPIFDRASLQLFSYDLFQSKDKGDGVRRLKILDGPNSNNVIKARCDLIDTLTFDQLVVEGLYVPVNNMSYGVCEPALFFCQEPLAAFRIGGKDYTTPFLDDIRSIIDQEIF